MARTSRRRPASRCVVENKAGASGAIAAEQVKSAPPDGYTLMWTISTTMIMNKVLFKKLPYDPDKDFVPISWMDAGHLPTIVSKNVPAKNLDGVRRLCAQQQGVARHLRRGLLQPCRRRGAEPPLRADHGGGALPRRGADVAGRRPRARSRAAAAAIAAAASVLQTGSGRPIAVPTKVRMKKLPDVPTFYEQGVTEPAFQVRGCIGLVGPAGDAQGDRAEALRHDGRGRQDRAHPEDPRHLRHRRGRARPQSISRRCCAEEGPIWIDLVKGLNLEPQ